jgi:ParB/RepB/Spo0J family partition protein
MAKQDLNKLLSQSAARSTPVEIRRGKGVGLSVDEQQTHNPNEPQVVWVDIDYILDNPYQHEEDINSDDFAALVESIKIDGFQGALNVSPVEGQEGYYFITGGGHQRRNAAREAQLKKIPVFVGGSPAEKKQLGLRLARENTAQVNRSPVNLGFLYIQLIEEFGMTQEEIAAEIKKDRYHVNFAIMAARSASDIRAALREKYSPRVMTYLRRLDDEQERAPIIAKYLSAELTVEGVRVAVEQAQEAKKLLLQPRQDASKPVVEESSQPQQHRQPVATGSLQNDQPQSTAPNDQEQISSLHSSSPIEEHLDQTALLQQVKNTVGLSEKENLDTSQDEQSENLDTSERISKAQAVFSRMETYRRHIDKKRADGEEVILTAQEETLLGKIIDRCHTLLDTYGKNVT